MSDKLLEVYDLRMSTVLKHNLKKMTDTELKSCLDEVRDLIARHVHNSKAVFKPSLYQNEEESN